MDGITRASQWAANRKRAKRAVARCRHRGRRGGHMRKQGKVKIADLVGIAPGFQTERQETEARITALEARVHRLRAFAEEMSWYAPEEDWEDAARRLLRYGDVHTIAEIREANAKGQGDGV